MIELRNLSKSFTTADGQVDALKHVSLTINDGDIYGIIGMSGAGKSTLVRCINMLERPTEGSVIWDGKDLGTLQKREIQKVRHEITMIFQSFNLLMQRTCLQNIMFPLRLIHMPGAQAKAKALQLLETVGLPDKANSYPAQLSGGQQQRVAIARALATNPKVLLCDEATSALDPKTTHSILELIRQINRDMGITVIVITHQMSVVQEICNRVAILENGAVVEEGDVSRVFSNPKARATKALVFPDVAEGIDSFYDEDQQTVRLVFQGAEATSKPLITSMAIDCNIAANILSATTRTLDGKIYGNMLLGIPGGPDQLVRAVKYLSKEPAVTVQVDVEYELKDTAPDIVPEEGRIRLTKNLDEAKKTKDELHQKKDATGKKKDKSDGEKDKQKKKKKKNRELNFGTENDGIKPDKSKKKKKKSGKGKKRG